MKLIIGADLVPTPSNYTAFENGRAEKLVDRKLLEILKEADYRIFNLEVPLTDQSTPIKKCGPNLIASTETVVGMKALGVDFFTLANNHILDHGEGALKSTIKKLQQQNIAYAGAGMNLEEASKPFVVEKENLRVGIYCCAEHEFSIAGNNRAGANPFDPLFSLDHIADLNRCCDYVIVLYHGGKEQYRYPSPYLQKVCRRIVDKGANLVICQHSHCIGCQEEWKGGTIVYGQGNFLFDNSTSEYWQTSLMISLDVQKGQACIEYIPLCKKGASVGVADSACEKEILDGFKTRSREILQTEFVEKNYQNFSQSMLSSYYSRTLGKVQRKFLFKVLNKLDGNKLRQKCYSEEDIYALINLCECEPHRELFIEGLRTSVEK